MRSNFLKIRRIYIENGCLIFSSGMRRAENRVRQIVWELGQGIELYRSVKRLSKRFDRPRNDICVMIFLIHNHKILNDLIFIRDQMYDLPVILILPKRNKEAILKGHKLFPRFLSYLDGDYSDLAVALQKIVSREKRSFDLPAGEVMPMVMGWMNCQTGKSHGYLINANRKEVKREWQN